MSDTTLVSLSAALLLAAGGILLWDMSVQRQRRQGVKRHLAERIEPTAAAMPLSPLRFGTPPSVEPMPRANKKPLFRLPHWMLGALKPGAVLAGLATALAMAGAAALLSSWISALGLLAALLVSGSFFIWLRVQKVRRHIIRQLPGLLDVIVRMIVVGNSTQAAFQMAIVSTKYPLREQMDNAMSMVKAGLDIDQALLQVARRVRIEEMFLLASILGLGVRYGGRSDVLLERVAHFMRDREEAENELVAMSAETRLSAWILGLLPVVVGGVIIATNAAYFGSMWNDASGRTLVFFALGLQGIGALLLYRLARLS